MKVSISLRWECLYERDNVFNYNEMGMWLKNFLFSITQSIEWCRVPILATTFFICLWCFFVVLRWLEFSRLENYRVATIFYSFLRNGGNNEKTLKGKDETLGFWSRLSEGKVLSFHLHYTQWETLIVLGLLWLSNGCLSNYLLSCLML